MSDWGITTKVPAEVVLMEGPVLEGDLHLYARPTYPPGPETPLEMLNRADVFFAPSSSPIVHQPIRAARTITATDTATAGTASAARFLAIGALYGPS